jgi:hypothetical protein
MRGERIECAEVADRFVRADGAAIAPSRDLAAPRELFARFQREVHIRHGVEPVA